MKVKCNKCEYEWNTSSERIYITCPNCQRKFIKDSKKKWYFQDLYNAIFFNFCSNARHKIEGGKKLKLTHKKIKDWIQKNGYPGCDGKLTIVKDFCDTNDLDFKKLEKKLNDGGGYCDCEVLYNVTEKYFGDIEIR